MSFSSSPSVDLTRREAIRRAGLLLGVALSPSLLNGVLRAKSGVAASAAPKASFSASQTETVAAVAERIIPRTDTPGAIDVGVPAFIDLMYGEYMTDEEKRTIAAGLADLEKRSKAAHTLSFAELAPAQQDALLKAIAVESQKKQKTFFHQMREATVLGFYSSEQIGKNVLHYNPVPGRFDPCVPIAEVGNVNWTK